MRDIFQHSGIAARRAIRDRNIAIDTHEPTFARRIQFAVAVNLISIRGDFVMAVDEFI